jgi:hypothetical protein
MTRKPKVRTGLQKFLNASVNTKTRERIFFNKFYFDVKLAAARRGYPLTMFEPEVDRGGFDVVLDDADTTRHLQLKSATRSSGTKQWATTPRFLRPTLLDIERMQFESSPQGEGLGGGVVLLLIDDSSDLCPITYFYTDLFVIASLASGLIRQIGSSRRPAKQTRREQAERIMHQLYTERNRSAPVKLPRGVFLEVKSPDCLLTIAGLHSLKQPAQMWSYNLSEAYGSSFNADESGDPDINLPKHVVARAHAAASALFTLVNDQKLMAFHSGIQDYDQPDIPPHGTS